MTPNQLQYVVVSIWLNKYVIAKETVKLQPCYNLQNGKENLCNVTRQFLKVLLNKSKTLYADNHNDNFEADNQSLRWFQCWGKQN